MSRHYDVESDTEFIIDPAECRFLHDEVWCMNPKCENMMGWIISDDRCQPGNCDLYEPEMEGQQ